MTYCSVFIKAYCHDKLFIPKSSDERVSRSTEKYSIAILIASLFKGIIRSLGKCTRLLPFLELDWNGSHVCMLIMKLEPVISLA